MLLKEHLNKKVHPKHVITIFAILGFVLTTFIVSTIYHPINALDSSSLSSFTPITLTQSGDVAHSDVQYQDAASVISALPTAVDVTLVDTSIASVPITWTDTSTYDPTVAASYTFTAAWGTLPSNANNDNNLTAPTVEVVVAAGSLGGGSSYTSGAFVTTWKTDNGGASNSTSITIPTTGGGYNYDVDWNNDGTFEEIGITGNVTHDFGTPGTYTIQIKGIFPRIYFNNSGDRQKILSVDQWGTNVWSSMDRSFMGAKNLQINASDAPNLSNVKNMSYMFYGGSSFNKDISSWDVSNVTEMSSLFSGATSFNQPLNSWNVSKVTNMNYMFSGVSSFNQPLDSWNVSKVVNMNGMFNNASSFNQPLDSWDVSSVLYMNSMFSYDGSFNQDISSWNVSNVVNMRDMFKGATSFNQDISSWNVSKVLNMDGMFAGATSFNQDISSWNVSKVVNIDGMFGGATSFNQPLNSWNVSNVINIYGMFAGATSFNQPLNSWSVSKVTDMNSMFAGATSFNQDISSWDVSSVTNMGGMFSGATLSTSNYDAILSAWSVKILKINVNFDGGDVIYCSSFVDRAKIIAKYNWTITDGGICADHSVSIEVTSFDVVSDFGAGSAGNAIYNDATSVIAALPSSVVANDNTVRIPVTTWEEVDTYNPSVAGSYTFRAVVGTMPDGFINTDNLTTTVEVVVYGADMSSYNTAIAAVSETTYTAQSWEEYQAVISANHINYQSTQEEVDAATLAITNAQANLIIFYPDAAPETENVYVAGYPYVGKILTAAYAYSDINKDLEGVSIYQWYKDTSGDENYAPINGATSRTYTILESDLNSHIRFGVTPVAQTGATKTGAFVLSNNILITTPQQLTVVYNFDYKNGGDSSGNDLIESNGKFYGMTQGGGFNNAGTIFELNPVTGVYTKLYDFDNTNGSNPYGSLTANGGLLYGFTSNGGENGGGVIFSYNPQTLKYTKLYDFDNTNGATPCMGSLLLSGGKLYGLASNNNGISTGKGDIFEFDIDSNTYTKLYEFNSTDGEYPYGSLVESNGKFYGMTQSGGLTSDGIIFEWDPTTKTITKQYNFDYVTGSSPHGSLIESDGKFYGMTYSGGLNGGGIIFEWDPITNTITKQYNFDSSTGLNPYGSLIESNGKFYGMTYSGGANSYGTIFEWDKTSNIITKQYNFDSTKGEYSQGSLIESNGKFYGIANYGGLNNYGIIFEWNPITVYWYHDDLIAADDAWTTTENWWADKMHQTPLGRTPNVNEDVITLGTVGPNANLNSINWISPQSIDATETGINFTGENNTPFSINTFGDTIFNNSIENYGLIRGNTTFNNDSSNQEGMIVGNATFNDTSWNSANGGTVTGNATFNGDLTEQQGYVDGVKTRRYTSDTYTGPVTRNFTTDRPWTLIADGVVVDVRGSMYDGSTTFEAINGGSFIKKEAIEVNSCAKFMEINADATTLNSSYILTSDLDCTSDGNGIMISSGGGSSAFTGVFNGGGHTITVDINTRGLDYIGLFGQADNATISNLNIAGSINSGEGNYYTGALVGYGTNLNIDNIKSEVNVSGGDHVGGLIGELDANWGNSTVNNSSTSGNITGAGRCLGGLIGYTYTGNSYGNIAITNSHTSGIINGSTFVGGLIGELDNTSFGNITLITDSYSTSSIIGTSGDSIGGLVGYVYIVGDNKIGDATAINILNSYHTTGSISGFQNVGGLIGYLNVIDTSNFNLVNSYATGIVSSADGSGYTGGLIGQAMILNGAATLSKNYFIGTVSDNSTTTGGLLGGVIVEGKPLVISDSYVQADIVGNTFVGGLVGEANGEISIRRSYASGTIKGNDKETSSSGAGLIGHILNNSSISDSFSTSSISDFSLNTTGAIFVKEQDISPTITNSFFDQTQSGTANCFPEGSYDGCTAVNTDGLSPLYFKNNSTNAPFDKWNFRTIWQKNVDSYPTFRAPGSDVELVFSEIESSLTSTGITNNLNSVDINNVTNFQNLYFEKYINEDKISRIKFTGALDLSSESTQTFLNSLSVYLQSGLGFINFDATRATELKNTGAELKMYHINDLGYYEVPPIIIRDDTGKILSKSDVNYPTISNASYSSENRGTLTFTTSHFTKFELPTKIVSNISGSYIRPVISFEGCGDRDTGYSTTTGKSCIGNVTIKIEKLGNSVLKLGSMGEAVKELQAFLNKKVHANLAIDGKLGKKTEAALKRYQKMNGLVVDGKAGKSTKIKISTTS